MIDKYQFVYFLRNRGPPRSFIKHVDKQQLGQTLTKEKDMPVSLKVENMYSGAIQRWNPYVGCEFDCKYCKSSFQRQQKRQKQRCMRCYEYTPHTHALRLNNSFMRTDNGEFIAVGLSGDVAFCPTEFLKRVVGRVERYSNRQFLFQSKAPRTFNRISFPDNVILGTTLETDRSDVYQGMSKAPELYERVKDLKKVKHPRKFVTIEPIMKFNHERLIEWVSSINPEIVWIGYDNHHNRLPEPDLSEVEDLMNDLDARGIKVQLKSIRERWDRSNVAV